MIIKTPHAGDPKPSEITREALYAARRQFLKLSGAMAAGAALARPGRVWAGEETPPATDFRELKPSPFSTAEEKTGFAEATSYNNFYEFGTDKSDPARNAHTLKTQPWAVTVEGAVARPKVFDIEALLKLFPLEERVYRLRCVEAWSMVIPWVGFPLAELLKRVEPTGNAKYVEFITLNDPEQMPGQRNEILDWPYVEGLRIDEAMHPLTILAVGLYGNVLPNQSGAPIRVVVPWKYGFKSGKSIVRIRLTEAQPLTSWMKAGPREYGFYANVNPDVDHPRWSQAKERRIGDFLKRPTQMFNGYAEQVAGLYTGMDLEKYF
ncbi:protein-methionine-sulfoxide reductase catalytic subunit MsrP [Methylomagnum sp.]